jgi:hypothetical protein
MKIPLWLLLLAAAPAQQDGFKVLLEFPVTDGTAEFSRSLSRDVLLQVRRATDARGLHMGWDLSANDRRMKRPANLFYECLCGHGPRLHDFYAWHLVTNHYPSERRLPVYGYPLELRVRCPDCEAIGQGADAHFVRGNVQIALRRLPVSNPRQRVSLR